MTNDEWWNRARLAHAQWVDALQDVAKAAQELCAVQKLRLAELEAELLPDATIPVLRAVRETECGCREWFDGSGKHVANTRCDRHWDEDVIAP